MNPDDAANRVTIALTPPKHWLLREAAFGPLWFALMTVAEFEAAEAAALERDDNTNGLMFRLLASTAAALVMDAQAPPDANLYIIRSVQPADVQQLLTRYLLLEHDGMTHAALITPTRPLDQTGDMEGLSLMAALTPPVRTPAERQPSA